MQWIEKQLSTQPMSLKELAEKTSIEEKRVYRALSSLHRSGQIVHFRDDARARTRESNYHRYNTTKVIANAMNTAAMASIENVNNFHHTP